MGFVFVLQKSNDIVVRIATSLSVETLAVRCAKSPILAVEENTLGLETA